jgi:PKD repeat protein
VVTGLGMLVRMLSAAALLVILTACILLVADSALAADEDFFGVEGRPVALNVTVDPGAPVDTWLWDFEGDGCFTWSSGAGPNTTHVYPEPGTYRPVLKAMNGTEFVGAWIFKALIDPESHPPTVVVNPVYVDTERGSTVIFQGTAVDDGQVVLYEWDFDGDGTFDVSSASTASFMWTYSRLGNFQAVLRATDDQGATGSATVTVVVRNVPPTVHANGIVSDVEEVELRVTADDPDGEVVTFEWEPGDGSEAVTTSSDRVTHSYPGLGEYRVNVTVTDNDGATATTFFTVERVEPWVLPGVTATVDRDQVYVGDTVTFDVEIIEGSSATHSYLWDLGDGNDSTERTLQHAYGQAGTFQVSVTVIDSRGIDVSDEVTVRVLWTPNEAPVAVPSVEQWVRPGRNLRFSDASYDIDGWIVLWQWDFDGDGTFDHSNTTDGNHTHVYPEEGVFTAVLQVTDNRGEVGVATVVIKVDRDAPGEEPVDDSQGAAVCCGVTVVVLVVVAYWAVRRSMATPRADGGPVGNGMAGSEEDEVKGDEGEKEVKEAPEEEAPPPSDD